MNKVFLVGNIGKDPDVRVTPSGKNVTNFSIATTETWKDKSGEVKKQTEWHTVVAWGGLADIANRFAKKGGKVVVMGKITTRTWDDKDGKKIYKTEVVAETLDFMLQKNAESQPAVDDTQAQQSGSFPADGLDLPF
jgi:single-strand DNA-binding protein